MRRIVIAKMLSLTLLGLYLTIGLTRSTDEAGVETPVPRCAE